MESLPIKRRGVWQRFGDEVYLCGTLGSEFDAYQRARAAVSASEAFELQRRGLEEVEALMDEMEDEARKSLAPNEKLQGRKSPGYGEMPLERSREIIDRLDATKKIGVTLTASNLLAPSKSVTAIAKVV